MENGIEADRYPFLDGKRFKLKSDNLQNTYISLFWPKANNDEFDDPADLIGACEVWVTLPDENQQDQQEARSNARVIAGLISLARENGATLEDVIEVMDNSVCSKKAISGVILQLLKDFGWR